MNNNIQYSKEQEDNCEDEDYSQDFEDSDILSVVSGSNDDILSPPSITRLSNRFPIQSDTLEGVDYFSTNDLPLVKDRENPNPCILTDFKDSEAEKFKKEFEKFRLRKNSNDDLESNKGNEIKTQKVNNFDATNTSGTKRSPSTRKIHYTVRYMRPVATQKSTSPIKQRIGYSTSRIEVLSQPRRKRLPPQMNTPTRVHTKSSWNEFLERQHKMQRQRQLKLEYKLKEREYNDTINKLKCSQCGNQQSFDEFCKEKLSCPCGTMYSKSCFHLRSFSERMFKSSVRKRQQIQKIISERQSVLEKGKVRFNTKTLNERMKAGQAVHPDDFLSRMANDLLKRKGKIEELNKQLDDDDKKKYKY